MIFNENGDILNEQTGVTTVQLRNRVYNLERQLREKDIQLNNLKMKESRLKRISYEGQMNLQDAEKVDNFMIKTCKDIRDSVTIFYGKIKRDQHRFLIFPVQILNFNYERLSSESMNVIPLIKINKSKDKIKDKDKIFIKELFNKLIEYVEEKYPFIKIEECVIDKIYNGLSMSFDFSQVHEYLKSKPFYN